MSARDLVAFSRLLVVIVVNLNWIEYQSYHWPAVRRWLMKASGNRCLDVSVEHWFESQQNHNRLQTRLHARAPGDAAAPAGPVKMFNDSCAFAKQRGQHRAQIRTARSGSATSLRRRSTFCLTGGSARAEGGRRSALQLFRHEGLSVIFESHVRLPPEAAHEAATRYNSVGVSASWQKRVSPQIGRHNASVCTSPQTVPLVSRLAFWPRLGSSEFQDSAHPPGADQGLPPRRPGTCSARRTASPHCSVGAARCRDVVGVGQALWVRAPVCCSVCLEETRQARVHKLQRIRIGKAATRKEKLKDWEGRVGDSEKFQG
ncbi:hypothetical protein C8R47DRAFT_1077816 [Mycena vitilis]|nr:hypothetical protein C8R47DRAFT_1077816 [Mycena vitilis]